MTNFVSVFVFPANLYTDTRSFFIVIAPSIFPLHLPTTADRTMIPIVSIVHPSHSLLSLIHTPGPLAVALLRSPVAAHPSILS